MERILTWNYGGGTQSTAIAILIAQGKLPKPDCIMIADTGREATETWEWTDRYVNPLLATVGLTVEVAPHSLATLDLYDRSGRPLMPVFYPNRGKNMRFCSHKWKAVVARKFYRGKGYGPKKPIITWLGISLDEIGRARSTAQHKKWQHMAYPLIELVPMRREHCRQLVLDVIGVEPPKTACWMCPYRPNSGWRHIKENYPEDFAAAVALERQMQAETGNQVFLHRQRIPLDQVDLSDRDIPTIPLLGEVAHCDSGQCWT